MTRRLAAVAAVLMLVSAVLLAVLAADVRQWETRLAHDDLAFREVPDHPGLFEPSERLPGGVARHLLGLEDDLAFRHAVQLLARSFSPAPEDPEPGSLRRAAEAELAEVARSGDDRTRRSQATNLLGVLAVARGGEAPGEVRGDRLESAIASFATAVVLDEQNTRAKYNLELALRTREAAEDVNLPRGSGGEGALGRAGSGY